MKTTTIQNPLTPFQDGALIEVIDASELQKPMDAVDLVAIDGVDAYRRQLRGQMPAELEHQLGDGFAKAFAEAGP